MRFPDSRLFPLLPVWYHGTAVVSDLSPYTIIQEITKQGTDPVQKPVVVMSIHYHFTTSPADALSPFALNDDLEVRVRLPPPPFARF